MWYQKGLKINPSLNRFKAYFQGKKCLCKGVPFDRQNTWKSIKYHSTGHFIRKSFNPGQRTIPTLGKLRGYAQAQNFEVFIEFIDYASIKCQDRTQYKLMMAAAKKNWRGLSLAIWPFCSFNSSVSECLEGISKLRNWFYLLSINKISKTWITNVTFYNYSSKMGRIEVV